MSRHSARRTAARRPRLDLSRWIRVGLVLVVAAGSAMVGLVTAPALAATDTGSAVTRTVDATRTAVDNGKETEIEATRHVSVTVSTTTDLRDRQNIAVRWTGAHPSANTDYDAVSTYADYAEYPMVVLQCRGVDAAAAPLSPTTCWQPWPAGRNQENNGGGPGGMYPPWRMDRYAAAADRQQYSQIPAGAVVGKCPSSSAVAQHNLPFVGADGTVFDGTANRTACGAAPPESASSAESGSVSLLPDQATFAETRADGTGEVQFNVRDAVTNSSLGCSATVACSLVAVPVMGTSCDVGGAGLPADQRPTGDDVDDADTSCAAKGIAPVGVKVSGNGNGVNVTYAVTGRLWWTASNWRNRVSFPLSFAPPANVCDLNGSAKAAPVYGSELLIQATTQWSTALCNGSQAGFKHIQTAEPQARTLLQQGLINAAFGSETPAAPFATPTVQAPVAATGFAVSFVIDDANHDPVSSLRLTPRLLAKLLTQSYPVRSAWAKGYTYTDPPNAPPADPLATNPLDITYDPEFTALNPGIGHQVNSQGTGALLSLSSQSDVMYALTSYIDADPEARAWLDGQADPWGMVVNPNYKAIKLPVATWVQLDTWSQPVNPDAESQCDSIDPQPPTLGRIASPLSRLVDIAQSVQFAQPAEQGKCVVQQDVSTGQINGFRYTRSDRQAPGFRFLLGVTSVADTYRYGLSTAALQSSVAATAPAQFTDATGRTFVTPTAPALKAAASHLQFDATTASWPVSADALRADAAAYPGFMLVYADVPASGLAAADAAAYSRMLTYLSGPGQVAGSQIGQLPSGYLPLTAENGLAALAGYTAKAAALVAAQQGLSPDQTPSASVDTSSGAVAVVGDVGAAGSGAPAGAAAPAAAAANTPVGATENVALATGTTKSGTSGTWAVVLIAVIIAAGLGPVGVPTFLGVRRWRAGR